MTKLREAMSPWWRPFLLGVLALASGCRGESQGPSTGSETHFLSWCTSDASCGDGLACLCGVCTQTCTGDAACTELASTAECVQADTRPAEHACPDTKVEASCEVVCESDGDCRSLGPEHRCDRGYCRSLPTDCETGGVAASEVVILGDSFLAENGAITVELEALARAAGALGSAETYRDYSSVIITPFGGASDLTGQYAMATSGGAIRVVVMDVGGPDSLLGTCADPPTETCAALQAAVSGADALWRQMADDGVEAVVDFFYPVPDDAVLAARFDVLRPMMEAACDESPVGCHFLDLRPTFQDRSTEYLLSGGVLPTAAGSAATARALWSLMQSRCIAQ